MTIDGYEVEVQELMVVGVESVELGSVKLVVRVRPVVMVVDEVCLHLPVVRELSL